MKRIGGLWPQVIDDDNLNQAFRLARHGKRNRPEVARFSLNWEHELHTLKHELQDRSYQPGRYRQFTIYERKARVISAAPFRDRVVHHALMRVVEPLLDRRMFFHSYACRQGKGVHAAVDYYQQQARRYAYVLKLDIRQYFPSIDRALLIQSLERVLKDKDALWLFERIIHTAPETTAPPLLYPGDDLLSAVGRSRGLPIGNLTSQVLANWYLNGLDHTIARSHRGAYLRYVDDLMLLGDDKAALWAMRDWVGEQLTQLRLQLHTRKAHIIPCHRKVDVLGYQVSRHKRWLRADNIRGARKRLRHMQHEYAQRRIGLVDVRQSIAAWVGHARHADSASIRRQVLAGVVFSRGAAPG